MTLKEQKGLKWSFALGNRNLLGNWKL